MKNIQTTLSFIVLLFLVPSLLLGQTTNSDSNLEEVEPIEIIEEDSSKTLDIPYAVIENVPVYPGCNGKDNLSLKNCMSEKISDLSLIHI